MSLARRLVQRLALVTPTATSTTDDDGQPVMTRTVETVACLVQPKTARERLQPDQAGAEIGTHTIYALPRDIGPGAWFSDDLTDPDAGARFDITGVRRYDFGRSPHLEIDARAVRP